MLSDLYLHRWDGARKRLVAGFWQHSNWPLPRAFFDQEFDCTFPIFAPPVASAPELGPRQLDALWADLASVLLAEMLAAIKAETSRENPARSNPSRSHEIPALLRFP
jgi:hypothetical protein